MLDSKTAPGQDASFVDEALLQRVPSWRNYLAAKLGFRNHWYPVKFSHDLAEGAVAPVLLCGEHILLKRVDGRVRALKDRCLHRGVRLSRKIECYTADTITCWYHGFTYRWSDGLLCDILAVPDSKAVGRRHLRSYPVEEAKGLIFVFVGDENFPAPPLAQDVPPAFLDGDMAILGASYMVKANWRLGAENGFDGIHVYIHRESPLIINTHRSLPLGHMTKTGSKKTSAEADGPKGLYDEFSGHVSVYEGKIQGQTVVVGTKNPDGAPRRTTGASIWLPGVMRIDNFPDGGLTQFEWYVPVTEDSHLYIITLGKRVGSEAERRAFEHEFVHRWKPVSLEAFNNQDIAAREATQEFYRDDWGWIEEGLIEADAPIIHWRELCHKYARGVQAPRHLR
jgi:carbazole 1,9a-dioxygenase terminal dioxygenase component